MGEGIISVRDWITKDKSEKTSFQMHKPIKIKGVHVTALHNSGFLNLPAERLGEITIFKDIKVKALIKFKLIDEEK